MGISSLSSLSGLLRLSSVASWSPCIIPALNNLPLREKRLEFGKIEGEHQMRSGHFIHRLSGYNTLMGLRWNEKVDQRR